jgi:hypothetical protein
MNFSNAFAFPILLATLLITVPVADTNQPSSTDGFTLTLRYGKETTLTHESVQILYQKAMELLESSNFNSRAPLWDWKTSQILEGYRTTVSGKYLLVTFNEPTKDQNGGGEKSL